MKTAAKPESITIAETKKLAENLVRSLQGAENVAQKMAGAKPKDGATILALYGDLGAGKTTFMQFLGEALGVREKMQSPTFVIEKIYKIEDEEIKGKFDHLVHIDAYRIENPQEMRTLGWDEIVKNPRNLIAVEWADKIAELLPSDSIRIEFAHHDNESRVIKILNISPSDSSLQLQS